MSENIVIWVNPLVSLFIAFFSIVLGQILLKLVLEPIQHVKKVLAEAAEELVYYFPSYKVQDFSKRESKSVPPTNETAEEMVNREKHEKFEKKQQGKGRVAARKQTMRILGAVNVVWCYDFFRIFFRMPSYKVIKAACNEIVMLSFGLSDFGKCADALHSMGLRMATETAPEDAKWRRDLNNKKMDSD